MTNDGIDLKELERRRKEKLNYEVRLITATTEGGKTAEAGARRAIIVHHPLDMMRKRSVITEKQFYAGDTLRKLFETAQSSLAAQGYDGMGVNDIYFQPKHGFSERIRISWREFNRITTSVPVSVGVPLVIVCCLGEPISVAYKCPPRGHSHTLSVGKFKLSLDLLAEVI